MHQSVWEHGGTDEMGAARHDFSTNANACGPCPEVVQAMQLSDPTRYPDPCYTLLRERLAALHGVGASRVLLTGSASAFILQMTAWFAQRGGGGGGEISVPAHGYSDYTRAAQAWGLRVHHRDGRRSAALRRSLVWHCDPSSPLGQSDTPALGSEVVLDRAYEPLRLEGVCAWTGAQLDQVWQLWTPNKALGLTGVRAAYVIAPVDSDAAMATLANLSPSWPVGSHGQALLLAWTRPEVQSWLAQSRPTLRQWKAAQVHMLGLLGWSSEPSLANFFIARPACAQPQASALAHLLADLRQQGIKLRDASSFGLPGAVRVSVQSPTAQEALAMALSRNGCRSKP